MTRHTTKQINQNGNGVNTPKVTITDAARRLGVSREHLSRVLHGHRKSRRLLARCREIGLGLNESERRLEAIIAPKEKK